MKKVSKTQPSHKATASKERIYLDYAAITPVDERVAAEMARAQKKFWANPASLYHEGESAKEALEEARLAIAKILHCRASEVIFTSGGTESLNLAILGISQSATLVSPEDDHQGKLPHVITSTIEHPAVLEPIKNLLKEKMIEVSFVSPNEKGVINPESIKKELKENTILVAIQHANNEIGTIQPIREISKIIHDSKLATLNSTPVLLVDACQSALYEDVSIERLGADVLALDGGKLYGPRGTGILVIKRNTHISPVMFGGGQEAGLRSGTQNVVGAVGLAKALEIAVQKRAEESARLIKLRDYAIAKISREVPHTSLNGDIKNRLPNNINICLASPKLLAKAGLPKLDSEFLVIKLDTLGFAVSAAAACHNLNQGNGSVVIESLGRPECAASSLRITFGRDTKKSDLDKLIAVLKKIIK